MPCHKSSIIFSQANFVLNNHKMRLPLTIGNFIPFPAKISMPMLSSMPSFPFFPVWAITTILFIGSERTMGASNRKADFSMQTSTIPSTRLRGQIGCYSCVYWTDWHGDFRQNMSPKNLFSNKSELGDIFDQAGMQTPIWAGRCAETNPTARPNFAGAELHICENSEQKPGACVKLKGQYKGRWFVYRDCWDRMWQEPRSYHHEYSGKCYADQPVQQFLDTERNTLCFCEEDLCNGVLDGRKRPRKDSINAILFLLLLFICHLFL